MRKMSEGRVDQNGKFYLNGTFRWVVSGLLAVLIAGASWFMTTIYAEVQENSEKIEKGDKGLEKRIREDINRLEDKSERAWKEQRSINLKILDKLDDIRSEIKK